MPIQFVQRPEGSRVKASKGEAVVHLLRSLGNEGSGALRPLN
jgi:hypothetical protein